MENDRLSTYLRARLRAMTYKGDDGLDDEAVHPKALPACPSIGRPSTSSSGTPNCHRRKETAWKGQGHPDDHADSWPVRCAGVGSNLREMVSAR